MEQNIYLSNTDIEDAVDIYLGKMQGAMAFVKKEFLDVRYAAGRVTSSPVYAKVSSPNHNAAAMDGIAVIASRTYEANEANPQILELGKDCEYINTGYVIAHPYDSVIMIEDVIVLDEHHVKIHGAASPWQHVRPIGEDIVVGEMIVPQKHTIRAMDIGAILSGGVVEIECYEKVRVGIIPTGNEITDRYDHLEKGKIFDTNSWVFQSLTQGYGAIGNRISPVEDTYEILKRQVKKMAEENHMVIINAGSSAGSKDFTSKVIEDLGELVLHGIAIKPGKPTILGMIEGKPVIGIPGYPGSAYLVFEEVAAPIIKKLQMQELKKPSKIRATLSRRIVSTLKYREYIRMKVGKVGEKLIATPLNRGAGVTMALVRSDGILIVPKNSEGYELGETVEITLENEMAQIDRTIVSIGSHDLIMDIIGSMLSETYDSHLSSAHVGSMGGIMALKRGEAHIAPIHLLDEDTGEYNKSYIQKYLAKENVELIKGVKRVQGMILQKGNPMGITSVKDLAREDIVFVNRQRGAGTRILTDYLLKKEGIDFSRVCGYDREMTTHMAVAAAVDSGTADVGIGVYSAAKALNLEFIPIGEEDYDFAVPKEHLETELIQRFLMTIHSDEFKDKLKELGGYGF